VTIQLALASIGGIATWRRRISGANLAGAMLRDTTFREAQLAGSTLTKIDASNARFIFGDLLSSALNPHALAFVNSNPR
jgi:uncharacterized protein YjbI with pentapeptide repeats